MRQHATGVALVIAFAIGGLTAACSSSEGSAASSDAEGDGVAADVAADSETGADDTGAGDLSEETDLADTGADALADAVDDGDADATELDGGDETGAEDAGGDAEDSSTGDAAAEVDLDDAEDVTAESDAAPTCEELAPAVTSAWDAIGACERSTQCAIRLNPVCPLGSCYTYFNSADDLTALESAESAYSDAMCSGGCRCVFPPPSLLSCVDGQCGPCPDTCETTCPLDCDCFVDACGCVQPECLGELSCPDQEARLEQAALDLSACSRDEDCTWTASPLCPELGCFLTVHQDAPLNQLQSLVDEYVANECHLAVCSCQPPPEDAVVACDAGHCVFAE